MATQTIANVDYQVIDGERDRFTNVIAEAPNEVIVARRKPFGEPNFERFIKVSHPDALRAFGTNSLTFIFKASLTETPSPTRAIEFEAMLKALISDADNELIVAELTDDEVDDIPVYKAQGFILQEGLCGPNYQTFVYQR